MTAYFFSNSAIIKRQLNCLRMMIMMRQKQSLVLLAVTKTASIFLRLFWTPLMFSSARRKTKNLPARAAQAPERAVRQLCHSCGRFRIRHYFYFSVDPADAREWSNCVSARLLYHTAPGLPTRFCTRRHLTFSPPLGYNKFYGTRPLLKRNTEV